MIEKTARPTRKAKANDSFMERRARLVQGDVEFNRVTNEAIRYLTEVRKLTTDVIDLYRLACNKRKEIILPFINQDNNLRLVKYRHPSGKMLQRKRRNDETGEWEEYECKTDCEKGGTGILFGSHLADPAFGPLIMCYGDYDAMACAVDGIQNCTSLPYGDSSLGWIDEQWDWIQTFDSYIVYPDYDKNPKVARQSHAKVEELVKRLSKDKCKIIRDQDRHGTKDANQLLIEKGPGFNAIVIDNAIDYPEPGLVKLAHYKAPAFKEGTPVGYKDIDSATGGLGDGLLSIVAGDNNAGKTTQILNWIAEMVYHRLPCFYWSGEQKPDRVRWWLEQIMAGPHFLASKTSPKTGREYWFANPDYVSDIQKWYEDYVIVYDKRGLDPEHFFEVLELAVKRYGIKFVAVDNLMAFTGGQGEQYYQSQGDFAESCKAFSENWNLHVMLAAHNKKIDYKKVPDKDDVEGSKKVTNWADFVFQLWRVPGALKTGQYAGVDGVVSLCKNRETETLVDVDIIFEPHSKRYAQLAEYERIQRMYGWEPNSGIIPSKIKEEDLGF